MKRQLQRRVWMPTLSATVINCDVEVCLLGHRWLPQLCTDEPTYIMYRDVSLSINVSNHGQIQYRAPHSYPQQQNHHAGQYGMTTL
jgi:hypothetical protein